MPRVRGNNPWYGGGRSAETQAIIIALNNLMYLIYVDNEGWREPTQRNDFR